MVLILTEDSMAHILGPIIDACIHFFHHENEYIR